MLAPDENGGNGSVLISQFDTPTIAGTVGNQTTTGTTPIDPFTGIVKSDPNLGSLPETATVTPSSTANSTLSDPGDPQARGRPPNNRIDAGIRDYALPLISEHYANLAGRWLRRCWRGITR